MRDAAPTGPGRGGSACGSSSCSPCSRSCSRCRSSARRSRTTSADDAPDATDPVRNVALPCEAVRDARRRARASSQHIGARRERLRDRRHGRRVPVAAATSTARVHDYAFVGTMGAGFRIFDVTDPAQPDAGRRLRRQRLAERRPGARRHRRLDVRRRRRRGLDRLDVPEDALPGREGAGRRHLPARTSTPLTAKFEMNLLDVRREPAGRRAQLDAPSERRLARDLELLLRLGGRRGRPARRRSQGQSRCTATG